VLSDQKKRTVYDRCGPYSDNLADAASRAATLQRRRSNQRGEH
jgi:DnaJ-class molecular chaperone